MKFPSRVSKILCRPHDDPRVGSFLKQRISIALQIRNAACVPGTVSDRDAFEENFLKKTNFLNLNIIAALKNFYRSTGIVAGMSCLMVVSFCYRSTGIVVGRGFPTFVADHGCVSSPPNLMIHMGLD